MAEEARNVQEARPGLPRAFTARTKGSWLVLSARNSDGVFVQRDFQRVFLRFNGKRVSVCCGES